MSKVIDIHESIHDMVAAHPEIVEILYELGFKDIMLPGMLQTAGRFMTIPKGAALKRIPISEIESKLRERGYTMKFH